MPLFVASDWYLSQIKKWQVLTTLASDGNAVKIIGQARNYGVAFGDSARPNIFVPPKLCCVQKKFFRTHNKTKYLSPLKVYLAPQTLKPRYGPVRG